MIFRFFTHITVYQISVVTVRGSYQKETAQFEKTSIFFFLISILDGTQNTGSTSTLHLKFIKQEHTPDKMMTLSTLLSLILFFL